MSDLKNYLKCLLVGKGGSPFKPGLYPKIVVQ
jgi:hypothetical protein